ncbi:MAG: nucleoside-diphosphate sugar epimerase/dehydratase [Bacteroidales bacterium]|nr:nucleoside-diphosphate sugar epimerase/dehydratase [Bacteroidales bacterium]
MISLVSIMAAYLLRFNFRILPEYTEPTNFQSFYLVVPVVLSIRLLSFLISRTYAGLVRYTSTKDAGRIFFVLIVGSAILGIINIVTYETKDQFFIPVSVIGIDFLMNVFLMTGSRFFVKAMYLDYTISKKEKQNALIFGISELALITKRTLSKDAESSYKIAAFIDNTNVHKGKKIDGLSVYGTEELIPLIEKYNINALIIAEKNIPSELKTEVIDICLQYNVKILSLPDVNSWINGELSVNQIREVRIEDLLERPPIQLDINEIRKYTLNKVILVTGAAGSIGSEIVKQLLRFQPKKIIIFDQAESPLYDLELELNEKYNFSNFEIVIGDLTNQLRLKKVFSHFKPSVVFHAGAYKHVPMMENNPAEAVRTNVYGTKSVADLSLEYGVNKFVMVSTDKAVNPTNVMGASKRIAEIYTQSLNGLGKTKFITTRFGNVLGSNGSVINRFRQQIQKGGPVTVTHPEITRYFMTIPEACQLVLEAGAMGKGGEIFIFDMGKSVKIVNLAKKMIQLSGLQLGKDIQISFTGLRPGEKLYEELLNDKENTLPTHHPKIMIGKVKKYDLSVIENEISELIIAGHTQDNFAIVKKMKKIVPEFLSHNSIYEEIDIAKKAAQKGEQKGEQSQKTIKEAQKLKD